MTPPRRPIVNLYCDFDGTLSPLPAKTTQQEQHAIDCHLQPKSIADCYTLDRQRPNLLNMQWSSELIALMRDLIKHRFVRWHWLTSNTAWTDVFDGMFGFVSNLTTTEELLTCRNGHVSMAPVAKLASSAEPSMRPLARPSIAPSLGWTMTTGRASPTLTELTNWLKICRYLCY